jgi:hypothetical protein
VSFWGFRPYVPAAVRRQQAEKEIEKLKKKGRVVAHRGQDRWRGPSDHEGVRRHGRDRGRERHEEEGGLKPAHPPSQTMD